jgi:hypothetical protein
MTTLMLDPFGLPLNLADLFDGPPDAQGITEADLTLFSDLELFEAAADQE